MNLCAINKCVSTILNKEKKKSWNEKDREIALFTVSLLQDWLDKDRELFETREITTNDIHAGC